MKNKLLSILLILILILTLPISAAAAEVITETDNAAVTPEETPLTTDQMLGYILGILIFFVIVVLAYFVYKFFNMFF